MATCHPVTLDMGPTDAVFELDLGPLGVADMNARLAGDTLSILHTEVPVAMRGQGVGEGLAAAALDYARERGWAVRPYCPFVTGFIDRRPAYAGLVDPSFSRARATPAPDGN